MTGAEELVDAVPEPVTVAVPETAGDLDPVAEPDVVAEPEAAGEPDPAAEPEAAGELDGGAAELGETAGLDAAAELEAAGEVDGAAELEVAAELDPAGGIFNAMLLAEELELDAAGEDKEAEAEELLLPAGDGEAMIVGTMLLTTELDLLNRELLLELDAVGVAVEVLTAGVVDIVPVWVVLEGVLVWVPV